MRGLRRPYLRKKVDGATSDYPVHQLQDETGKDGETRKGIALLSSYRTVVVIQLPLVLLGNTLLKGGLSKMVSFALEKATA